MTENVFLNLACECSSWFLPITEWNSVLLWVILLPSYVIHILMMSYSYKYIASLYKHRVGHVRHSQLLPGNAICQNFYTLWYMPALGQCTPGLTTITC